jgi:hypothetical protein
MAREKIKLEEEAISEILVADTDLESGLRLAMFNILRKKKKRGTTTSLSRSRTTGCKWWITKLPTASRKEHKYSSFCWSSKMCGKKCRSTHQ